MTVINSTRKVRANGDGIVTEFQFSFPAKVATDVVVKKILNSSGVATTQTVDVDYTIALSTVTEGGTITYTVAPSALQDSFIIRETTQDQQTSLPIGGNFPEISVENEIDRSRLIDIELQETLDRAITIADTESITGINLPLGASAADRAGKALVWNTDGDDLTLGDEIGTYTGDWAVTTDYIERDLIKDTSNSNIYYCNTAHTSVGAEPISGNADVAKWDLIVDAASAAASAAAAASSATDAETAQTAAESAETAAGLSETAAGTSETNAGNSETAAAASAAAAAVSADNFDDTYLGSKTSDPALDNDGDPLTAGDLYFNSNSEVMRVFTGSAWEDATLSGSGIVQKTASTGSAIMPSGTTGERDGSPVAGYMRWNSTISAMELYSGSSWGAVGGLPRGHISGLITSNDAGQPTKDINITEGICRDSTNTDDIALTSEITKQIDASWAVGDDAGGLDGSESVGGTPDGDTWYHMFLIKRQDTGVVDVLFSESATAPTLPTDYDVFRRIGTTVVGSGLNLLGHSQKGDEFLKDIPVQDYSSANNGTSAVTRTLAVPTGITVWAMIDTEALDITPTTTTHHLITSLEQNDSVPSSSAFTLRTSSDAARAQGYSIVKTNTSGQIRTRAEFSAADIWDVGITRGWIDRRGQDD